MLYMLREVRGNIMTLRFLVFFALVGASVCQSNSDGHVIQLSDARVAAEASKHIYSRSARVGSAVPNSGGFVVERLVEPHKFKAYVAKKGNTRLIVFRGTDGACQLTEQVLRGIRDIMTNQLKVTIGDSHVGVLSFVWDAHNKMLNDLLPYTKERNMKYIIAGHSMGGSLATLFSLMANYDYINPGGHLWDHQESSLITFGENRLGDRSFADLHDREINPSRKVRFVYFRDPVPHIPAHIAFPFFTHHSREVWLVNEFLLHMHRDKTNNQLEGGEQYFPLSPAWRVCKEKDTIHCSNGIPGNIVILNHNMDNYIHALKRAPRGIENKDGRRVRSWEEAWKTSN